MLVLCVASPRSSNSCVRAHARAHTIEVRRSDSDVVEEEVGDDDDDARSVQNLQNVRFIHRGKSIPLAKTDDGVFVVVAVVVLGGAPPSSIDNDDEDFLSCCFFVDDRRNDHSSHASCTEIVAFVPSVFPFKHARKQK